MQVTIYKQTWCQHLVVILDDNVCTILTLQADLNEIWEYNFNSGFFSNSGVYSTCYAINMGEESVCLTDPYNICEEDEIYNDTVGISGALYGSQKSTSSQESPLFFWGALDGVKLFMTTTTLIWSIAFIFKLKL